MWSQHGSRKKLRLDAKSGNLKFSASRQGTRDSQHELNIVWWGASAKTQIARVLFLPSSLDRNSDRMDIIVVQCYRRQKSPAKCNGNFKASAVTG